MEPGLLQTLLWISVLVSVGTVIGGSALTARGTGNDVVDIGGGLLAVLLWALVGFGAMNVERVVGSSVQSSSEPALAYFAAVMAAIMLVFAFVGSARLVDVLNNQPVAR